MPILKLDSKKPIFDRFCTNDPQCRSWEQCSNGKCVCRNSEIYNSDTCLSLESKEKNIPNYNLFNYCNHSQDCCFSECVNGREKLNMNIPKDVKVCSPYLRNYKYNQRKENDVDIYQPDIGDQGYSEIPCDPLFADKGCASDVVYSDFKSNTNQITKIMKYNNPKNPLSINDNYKFFPYAPFIESKNMYVDPHSYNNVTGFKGHDCKNSSDCPWSFECIKTDGPIVMSPLSVNEYCNTFTDGANTRAAQTNCDSDDKCTYDYDDEICKPNIENTYIWEQNDKKGKCLKYNVENDCDDDLHLKFTSTGIVGNPYNNLGPDSKQSYNINNVIGNKKANLGKQNCVYSAKINNKFGFSHGLLTKRQNCQKITMSNYGDDLGKSCEINGDCTSGLCTNGKCSSTASEIGELLFNKMSVGNKIDKYFLLKDLEKAASTPIDITSVLYNKIIESLYNLIINNKKLYNNPWDDYNDLNNGKTGEVTYEMFKVNIETNGDAKYSFDNTKLCNNCIKGENWYAIKFGENQFIDITQYTSKLFLFPNINSFIKTIKNNNIIVGNNYYVKNQLVVLSDKKENGRKIYYVLIQIPNFSQENFETNVNSSLKIVFDIDQLFLNKFWLVYILEYIGGIVAKVVEESPLPLVNNWEQWSSDYLHNYGWLTLLTNKACDITGQCLFSRCNLDTWKCNSISDKNNTGIACNLDTGESCNELGRSTCSILPSTRDIRNKYGRLSIENLNNIILQKDITNICPDGTIGDKGEITNCPNIGYCISHTNPQTSVHYAYPLSIRDLSGDNCTTCTNSSSDIEHIKTFLNNHYFNLSSEENRHSMLEKPYIPFMYNSDDASDNASYETLIALPNFPMDALENHRYMTQAGSKTDPLYRFDYPEGHVARYIGNTVEQPSSMSDPSRIIPRNFFFNNIYNVYNYLDMYAHALTDLIERIVYIHSDGHAPNLGKPIKFIEQLKKLYFINEGCADWEEIGKDTGLWENMGKGAAIGGAGGLILPIPFGFWIGTIGGAIEGALSTLPILPTTCINQNMMGGFLNPPAGSFPTQRNQLLVPAPVPAPKTADFWSDSDVTDGDNPPCLKKYSTITLSQINNIRPGNYDNLGADIILSKFGLPSDANGKQDKINENYNKYSSTENNFYSTKTNPPLSFWGCTDNVSNKDLSTIVSKNMNNIQDYSFYFYFRDLIKAVIESRDRLRRIIDSVDEKTTENQLDSIFDYGARFVNWHYNANNGEIQNQIDLFLKLENIIFLYNSSIQTITKDTNDLFELVTTSCNTQALKGNVASNGCSGLSVYEQALQNIDAPTSITKLPGKLEEHATAYMNSIVDPYIPDLYYYIKINPGIYAVISDVLGYVEQKQDEGSDNSACTIITLILGILVTSGGIIGAFFTEGVTLVLAAIIDFFLYEIENLICGALVDYSRCIYNDKQENPVDNCTLFKNEYSCLGAGITEKGKAFISDVTTNCSQAMCTIDEILTFIAKINETLSSAITKKLASQSTTNIEDNMLIKFGLSEISEIDDWIEKRTYQCIVNSINFIHDTEKIFGSSADTFDSQTDICKSLLLSNNPSCTWDANMIESGGSCKTNCQKFNFHKNSDTKEQDINPSQKIIDLDKNAVDQYIDNIVGLDKYNSILDMCSMTQNDIVSMEGIVSKIDNEKLLSLDKIFYVPDFSKLPNSINDLKLFTDTIGEMEYFDTYGNKKELKDLFAVNFFTTGLNAKLTMWKNNFTYSDAEQNGNLQKAPTSDFSEDDEETTTFNNLINYIEQSYGKKSPLYTDVPNSGETRDMVARSLVNQVILYTDVLLYNLKLARQNWNSKMSISSSRQAWKQYVNAKIIKQEWKNLIKNAESRLHDVITKAGSGGTPCYIDSDCTNKGDVCGIENLCEAKTNCSAFCSLDFERKPPTNETSYFRDPNNIPCTEVNDYLNKHNLMNVGVKSLFDNDILHQQCATESNCIWHKKDLDPWFVAQLIECFLGTDPESRNEDNASFIGLATHIIDLVNDKFGNDDTLKLVDIMKSIVSDINQIKHLSDGLNPGGIFLTLIKFGKVLNEKWKRIKVHLLFTSALDVPDTDYYIKDDIIKEFNDHYLTSKFLQKMVSDYLSMNLMGDDIKYVKPELSQDDKATLYSNSEKQKYDDALDSQLSPTYEVNWSDNSELSEMDIVFDIPLPSFKGLPQKK